MDGLPPEILSNILDVLQGNGFERLSPYSSISRVWQTTVEKRTFRNVTVGIDPRAIDKLHATIVTGNVSRAHLVRTINVDLGQSPLDSEARPDGPRRIDTAWWTAAMARLFTALAKIVALMSDSTNVRLIFFAHVRTPTVADWGPILRDTPTSIPELRRVVSVAWRHPIPFVSEADFLALTDKLPDLEECDIDTRDDYDWGRRRRMKCRKELATALFNLSCAKLGTIGIRSVHTECYDEARDPTRLVSPYSCEEDLTLKSMQHLSTLPQLTVLHLTGSHIVSVSFFGNLPLFPTLSEFQLDFAASTTDARWFFVPDEVLIAKIKSSYEDEEESIHEYDSDSDRADPVQLYDSDDEDGPLVQRSDWSSHFRTMPNPETIPDFLINAAEWVRMSPRLRKFILRHRRDAQRNHICWDHEELIPYGRHVEVWYLRSGASCDHGINIVPTDAPFTSQDRMYWRVGDRWRPDTRIVEAWRRAVGPDVKHCFLKDIYSSDGRSMTWQYTEDLQNEQYVLDVEWEEPGGSIDLDTSELKRPFERTIFVHGPWLEAEVRERYRAEPDVAESEGSFRAP